MEAMQKQKTEALESEVEELKSALTTVTEALILFQEFIETEIGDMSYFRESGSSDKLVEILNRMRVRKGLKADNSGVKHSSISKQQYRNSMEMEPKMTFEDDDEQVEVDVDYNDDDPVDEITIRQVYSVPSPEKEAAENLLRMSNSAITITPVYGEERRRETFMINQSAFMMVKSPPPPPPQLIAADASFITYDNQRTMPQTMQSLKPEVETKDNEKIFTANNGNPIISLSPAMPMPLPLILPAFIPANTNTQENKQALKLNRKKKSLLRINNPNTLKKKVGKAASQKIHAERNQANGHDTDKPLNLKKKMRRKSDCPVSCFICGKPYSSKGVMSRHIKEAHKEDPQFPCFYCPKKFRNGPARLEHMNVDHPEEMKCVVCPYCKRKSSSVAGKRNHMMLCARKHHMSLGNLPQANGGIDGAIEAVAFKK